MTCAGLAIVPTEMDVLIEGDAPEPPQPTVPAAAPSAEPSRAAATAPLPAAVNAGMATAAATVTTAAAVASAKGAGEGVEEADISVTVLPPSPPRLRYPEVRREPTEMDGLRLRPARP